MSLGGLNYPAYSFNFGSKPRLQTVHPFRNLVAAGSNAHNQWSGASGQSGYGLEAPDYDYHSGPSAHVPSGGSYSYHATAGSGYGPPAAPVMHPPAKPAVANPAGGKKGLFGGGKRSSAVSALTLLSFLFFINLLQGCIKDHMDAMNPTVMVMTTNIIRNRFNKMGEMNSREQSSFVSNDANIVVKPADIIQAAAAQSPPAMEVSRPLFNAPSTYSNSPVSYNKPIQQTISQPPAQNVHYNAEPEIPIKYAKPQFDPQKPYPDDHQLQPHYTLSYDNHTFVASIPPYKVPSVEQHYNFHHTEYSAQPPPKPSVSVPQYGPSQGPLYEHQHPLAAKPNKGDYGSYGSNYGGTQQVYDVRKKYEMSQQQQRPLYTQSSVSNNDHPWSSSSHTSSVVSGPYRRASVISVSPKTKWITVPAKITDHTHMEDIEGKIEHHDDRDVFRSRLNN